MAPPVSTAGNPPAKGGGKKVLGMDRRVAVIAGVALLGGVLFIIWRNHQAAASSGGDTSGDTSGAGDTAAPPDTSGVQGGAMQGATGTETLVIKIKQLQGHKPKPHRKPPPGKHFPREPRPPREQPPPRRWPGGDPHGPPIAGRGGGRGRRT